MNIKQKSDKFRTIVNEMADLYEKKNSNYGDSFGQLFKELGPTAGLVPLWNKLHRATSLVKGNKNNFESLEDTFKDLACYAIMNLIEMEAQKDKKHEEESLITKYDWTDNCGDCPVKDLLKTGATYVGDIPCQWCKKNPCNPTCGTTTTIINNDKLTANNHLDNKKGEINSEK